MKKMLIVFLLLTIAVATDAFADETEQAEQQFAEFDRCQLSSGDVIAPCRIGYRTFGTLNDDKSNVVLAPTWYTGTSESRIAGLRERIFRDDGYFVIAVDALGNGVSSSPSNSDTQPLGAFPKITIADMVDSQHRLLTDVLEIQSVHAVVGSSMGGMQAFEWAVRYPGFAERTVATIGSPRLASTDIALWETQNRLFAMFRDCECDEPLAVMAGIGMLLAVPTKLSEDLAREDVIETIARRGAENPLTIAQSWDRERQAYAMIEHNIARDFDNDLKLAASHMNTRFLIIVGDDDRVVTPTPAREFAKLVNAEMLELDEDCGHGDPGCAPDVYAATVQAFIERD